MIVYSPASFLLEYLTVSVEDVGVEVICEISDGLMSFPALDQTDFGRGLPRILMALKTIVSPALTVSPSFMVGSRTMVGASAKKKIHFNQKRKET